MIGNDVVDLGHASVQPGAQHPRFDARVFAPRERGCLARAPELRWRYWAAKEAAYKAAKKLAPETVWSPAKFVVEAAHDAAGRAFLVSLVEVNQDAGDVHPARAVDASSLKSNANTRDAHSTRAVSALSPKSNANTRGAQDAHPPRALAASPTKPNAHPRTFAVSFLEPDTRGTDATSDARCLHAVAQSQRETTLFAYGLARLRGGAWEYEGARVADASPSRVVRDCARRTLARKLGCAAARLRIETRARIPRLLLDGARAPLDLSLSHHGDFVAWAAERAR